MSSSLAFPTFALSLCLAVIWCSPARASTEPIRIEYNAAPGCPNAREFQRKVFERTASARVANTSEPARVFKVVLRRAGKQISGSLVIQEPDGNTVARKLSGDNCAEVALVLALASALAIDPRAELAPREQLEDTSADPEADVGSGAQRPGSDMHGSNDGAPSGQQDTSSSGLPDET